MAASSVFNVMSDLDIDKHINSRSVTADETSTVGNDKILKVIVYD